jgi:hypothetical protein
MLLPFVTQVSIRSGVASEPTLPMEHARSDCQFQETGSMAIELTLQR